MADHIEGHLGDDVAQAIVGKGIRQTSDSYNTNESREQHTNNAGGAVHIAMERLSEVSQRETDTINGLILLISPLINKISELTVDVRTLTRVLAGDPLRMDGKGLVQQVRELDQISRRREWWRVTSTVALVLLVIMQAVQWWFIWRIYDLYWVIYQAVN